MNKLLQVNKIKKIYHDKSGEVTALDDISFDVLENEFIAIVGPSGCGKSTFLSILAGIENKSSGSFNFNKKVTIGYMLQDDSLFPWKTLLENCLVGLEVTGKLNKEDYVLSLLKKYNLYDFKDKYPSCLSGGMKQRVG